ncbi:hypothetical protein A11A3_08180 [Alcanivorax hongdengensis A-11-3]|uniref:Uncharacterized protein n=1 Tax=Alcanivorax hongdengensis A-11-3 TaxID=1177179 RepID=L0WC72_9GAMM|nr:hypothetical protein A11A3_08180 [Alcanivorax hongdengensis A-11-3]
MAAAVMAAKKMPVKTKTLPPYPCVLMITPSTGWRYEKSSQEKHRSLQGVALRKRQQAHFWLMRFSHAAQQKDFFTAPMGQEP